MPNVEAEPPSVDAGKRFREIVEVALARSHRLHSMADLQRCTGLNPNTLYDIFNGQTKDGPGPRTVNLLATCLDIPTRHLWDAWQGREPEPDSAEEALRQHIEAVDEQNRLLGELVGFIRSAAIAVAEPLDDPDEEAEAQARAGRRREPPAGGASEGPPVPHESTGLGRR